MVDKFFIVAHLGGKSYADGAIVLIRHSEIQGKKEIVVVGPWNGPGPQYIVEEWPSSTYTSIVRNGRRLGLPDSLWDATVRLRDIEKTDSAKEKAEIMNTFEKLLGPDLVIEMHLVGAF
jgi:hypothetical protein